MTPPPYGAPYRSPRWLSELDVTNAIADFVDKTGTHEAKVFGWDLLNLVRHLPGVIVTETPEPAP